MTQLKKLGFIKSVPLSASGAKKGVQVIMTTEDKQQLVVKISRIEEGFNFPIKIFYKGSTFHRKAEELKLLVVQYVTVEPNPRFNGKVDMVTPNQILLKESQWEKAIEYGEVNSMDKTVTFETVLDDGDTVARVIHSNEGLPRTINEFEMAITRAYNAGKQAMSEQYQNGDTAFKSSIEYFRTEFPELAKKIY